MKNAKHYLDRMKGDKTYITTRGTVGDADGTVMVDDIIERFGAAATMAWYKAPVNVQEDIKRFARYAGITLRGLRVADVDKTWIVLW